MTYQVPLDPSIDLGQRWRLDCADIDRSGQVAQVVHRIDYQSGRRTTELTLALGGGSVGAYTLPSAPSTTGGYAAVPSSITLPTYLGNDDSADEQDEDWTGYVGNWQLARGMPSADQIYSPSFAVEYPEIPDSHREQKDVTADALAVTVAMVYPD
jgi:hypothetical protein